MTNASMFYYNSTIRVNIREFNKGLLTYCNVARCRVMASEQDNYVSPFQRGDIT